MRSGDSGQEFTSTAEVDTEPLLDKTDETPNGQSMSNVVSSDSGFEVQVSAENHSTYQKLNGDEPPAHDLSQKPSDILLQQSKKKV